MMRILYTPYGHPELEVDGRKCPARDVRFTGTNGQVRIHVRNGEFVQLIASHQVFEIPEEVEALSIDNLHTFFPEEDFKKQSVTIFRNSEGVLRLGLAFVPDTDGWKHLWSIREYGDELLNIIETKGRSGLEIKIGGKVAWLSVSTLFKVSFPIKDVTASIYSEALNHETAVREIHALTEASLESKLGSPKVEQIIRSIEFPPEYHRSGITILSYFADVLRHKNLSEDVKVSIEQNGLNVSLVIESPTGQRDEVQRTLEAYALVVTGRQPVETLTTDPYEIAELKSQLSLANVQIETHRALLAAKTSEVSDVRAEVRETKAALQRVEQRADEDRARFLTIFEGLVSQNTTLATGFKELAEQAAQAQHNALAGALDNLYKVIQRGVREEDREEVIQNLTTIRGEDPGVFRQVSDILLSGALSNAAGNYMYSWLQFLVGSLPK